MPRVGAAAVAVTETAASPAAESAGLFANASTALQLLSAAALLLPGVLAAPVQAADAATERVALQMSRHEEGRRDLESIRSSLAPIRVDVLQGSVALRALDRLRLSASYSQDTWSGATPVTTAPLAADGNRAILRDSAQGVVVAGASPFVNNTLQLDAARRPLRTADDARTQVDERTVHILSSASPETRDQLDVRAAWDWDNAMLEGAWGVSLENDYESAWGNVNARFDFNQKLTSLAVGAGYTHSRLDAILDPDLQPYLTRGAYQEAITRKRDSEILHGSRHDLTAHLGLTQVIDRSTVLDLALGYTRARGFMENPYKATSVLFVDPSQSGRGIVTADMRALLEQRPERNEQLAANLRLVRYIAPLDAALHLAYRYSEDDWDVRTHTLEAEWVQPLPGGWTLAPRLRYYTQTAASFHVDYLVSEQAYRRIDRDGSGRDIWFNPALPQALYYRNGGQFVDAGGVGVDPDALNLQPRFVTFDPGLLPAHFSSDHRLAGFGALSAGLSLSKQITRGLYLEAGAEVYTRRSGLQAGGGDSAYADFRFHTVSAGLRLDLDETRLRTYSRARAVAAADPSHAHHAGHRAGMHAAQAPAGVQFGHVLPAAGDFMLAWRFGFSRQAGALVQGSAGVTDQEVVATACAPQAPCRFVPTYMNMQMHMVDIMYAASDRLTLMLMPQFMTMDMNLRELAGRPPAVPGVHEHTGIGGHRSGSLGDTVLAGLYQLGALGNGAVHLGLGLSIPTGRVDQELRRMFRSDGGLMHFDMQTGSGTWDLLPSVTWLGALQTWQLGAQLSAVHRLHESNEAGYRLGDGLQASAWVGRTWANGLGLSLRAVQAWREDIAGDWRVFNARIGPMDYPHNQGGRSLDAALGLSWTVPAGRFAGHALALEWSQPVHEDLRGVQLPRRGTLSASWQLHF